MYAHTHANTKNCWVRLVKKKVYCAFLLFLFVLADAVRLLNPIRAEHTTSKYYDDDDITKMDNQPDASNQQKQQFRVLSSDASTLLTASTTVVATSSHLSVFEELVASLDNKSIGLRVVVGAVRLILSIFSALALYWVTSKDLFHHELSNLSDEDNERLRQFAIVALTGLCIRFATESVFFLNDAFHIVCRQTKTKFRTGNAVTGDTPIANARTKCCCCIDWVLQAVCGDNVKLYSAVVRGMIMSFLFCSDVACLGVTSYTIDKFQTDTSCSKSKLVAVFIVVQLMVFWTILDFLDVVGIATAYKFQNWLRSILFQLIDIPDQVDAVKNDNAQVCELIRLKGQNVLQATDKPNE